MRRRYSGVAGAGREEGCLWEPGTDSAGLKVGRVRPSQARPAEGRPTGSVWPIIIYSGVSVP